MNSTGRLVSETATIPVAEAILLQLWKIKSTLMIEPKDSNSRTRSAVKTEAVDMAQLGSESA